VDMESAALRIYVCKMAAHLFGSTIHSFIHPFIPHITHRRNFSRGFAFFSSTCAIVLSGMEGAEYINQPLYQATFLIHELEFMKAWHFFPYWLVRGLQ
jgi:hypothetical protein